MPASALWDYKWVSTWGQAAGEWGDNVCNKSGPTCWPGRACSTGIQGSFVASESESCAAPFRAPPGELPATLHMCLTAVKLQSPCAESLHLLNRGLRFSSVKVFNWGTTCDDRPNLVGRTSRGRTTDTRAKEIQEEEQPYAAARDQGSSPK
jgi:hypothetical protein